MTMLYCVQQCNAELNNEHISWCKFMNKYDKYKYFYILNGDESAKKGAFKQIKQNIRIREEETTPVIY